MILKEIITYLSIFGVLFGVISSISLVLLKTIANPQEGIPLLLKEISLMFINSQETIYRYTDFILKAKTQEEISFGILKIISASIVSLFFIYIFYRLIKFFVESPKPTDKIVIILISLFIPYLISLISSFFFSVSVSSPFPYHGWIHLILNLNKILTKIS